jgi:hypothetical protein
MSNKSRPKERGFVLLSEAANNASAGFNIFLE